MPHSATPARLPVAYWYLLAATAIAVTAVILFVIDLRTPQNDFDPNLHAMARVAALGAWLGYFISAAETRVRRSIEELHQGLDQIQQEPSRSVPTYGRVYACAPSPRSMGRVYAGRTAEAATSTVMPSVGPEALADSTAVIPLPGGDSLRAARNLAKKVIASERRRAEDNSEDTRRLRT